MLRRINPEKVAAFNKQWRILLAVGMVLSYIWNGYNTITTNNYKNTTDAKIAKLEDEIDAKNKEIKEKDNQLSYFFNRDFSNAKLINEHVMPWWKKEYYFYDKRIVMRSYNTAFFQYFLKDLKLPKFHYVGKTDCEVFQKDECNNFYEQDLTLVEDFLAQPLDTTGKRGPVARYYAESFTDLQGVVYNSGFWKFVIEEDGHIYVYGELSLPIAKILD